MNTLINARYEVATPVCCRKGAERVGSFRFSVDPVLKNRSAVPDKIANRLDRRRDKRREAVDISNQVITSPEKMAQIRGSLRKDGSAESYSLIVDGYEYVSRIREILFAK